MLNTLSGVHFQLSPKSASPCEVLEKTLCHPPCHTSTPVPRLVPGQGYTHNQRTGSNSLEVCVNPTSATLLRPQGVLTGQSCSIPEEKSIKSSIQNLHDFFACVPRMKVRVSAMVSRCSCNSVPDVPDVHCGNTGEVKSAIE